MKITDEMIREYCRQMDYALESIGKISFTYAWNSNGSRHALLKAAAAPNNLPSNRAKRV